MDQDMLDGIEAFRADQEDKPNQSEAVRRIIRDWLTGHNYITYDASHSAAQKE